MRSNELPYQAGTNMQPISRNRLLESLYANDVNGGDRTTQLTMTPDEIIQYHIHALGLADQRLVKRATNQLLQIGEPAVRPLIQVLRHDNRLVSIHAKAALHAIGEPAIHPLIEALRDPHLRMIVKTVLANFGESAIQPLLETLENADDMLTIAICSTFGMMGEPALRTLRATLDTQDGAFKTKLVDCIEIVKRDEI